MSWKWAPGWTSVEEPGVAFFSGVWVVDGRLNEGVCNGRLFLENYKIIEIRMSGNIPCWTTFTAPNTCDRRSELANSPQRSNPTRCHLFFAYLEFGLPVAVCGHSSNGQIILQTPNKKTKSDSGVGLWERECQLPIFEGQNNSPLPRFIPWSRNDYEEDFVPTWNIWVHYPIFVGFRSKTSLFLAREDKAIFT